MVSYSGCVETVFRALADPTRRALLDELFERDGQTLVALTARHDMTRIGVAKHLRLLEEAGLVVSRRRGREKLHFLNPVPIRLIHDRWVSKYTEPWAAGLAGLKRELESPMEKVFEIYIRTTPERLWAAITDPEIRAKYHFGAGGRVGLDAGLALHPQPPRPRRPARRGREPGRRAAAPARADDAHAVERRGRAGRHHPGDLGDRAGRRLLPPDGHPRPAQRATPRRSCTAAGR